MKEPVLEANADAPAYATADIDITAPPSVVWQLMTAVDDWPVWNPDIKSARLEGRLAPGAGITWKSGPGTIRSKIADIAPEQRLSWTGSMLGIRAIHVWALTPSEDGTRVRTEESWSGFVPRLLRGYSQKTIERALSDGLRYLKSEAERKAQIAS